MALLTRPTGFSIQGLDFPSRLFETGGNDYELFEEDEAVVLSVEMPGFDPADIDVSWDAGALNISGEHEDEERGQRRTYHRRFRFPKDVDDDGITAEYDNGILEVRLPVVTGGTVTGKQIEVQG